VTSVSIRACSNMADDKEAVVLACTSLVFCAPDLQNSTQFLVAAEAKMNSVSVTDDYSIMIMIKMA